MTCSGVSPHLNTPADGSPSRTTLSLFTSAVLAAGALPPDLAALPAARAAIGAVVRPSARTRAPSVRIKFLLWPTPTGPGDTNIENRRITGRRAYSAGLAGAAAVGGVVA